MDLGFDFPEEPLSQGEAAMGDNQLQDFPEQPLSQPQQQQQPQARDNDYEEEDHHHNAHRLNSHQEAIASVNGLGMWKSWGRNFTSPQLALMDLFDNAIDATLPPEAAKAGYQNKEMIIKLFLDKQLFDAKEATGIVMMNNCYRRIPQLQQVLSIHKSTKEDTDQIGENGVGVKQACAALAKLSFVLTKNKHELGLGILAECLQATDEPPYLPSWNFIVEDGGSITHALTQRINESDALEECVRLYGEDDVERGLQRLEAHYKRMMIPPFADQNHVFTMVMHDIRHAGSVFEGPEEFLQLVRKELPRNYLHVPVEFDVRVLGTKVDFQYWQRRLVELTKFQSRLDPENSYKDSVDWDWPGRGYPFNIYLGFDPYRSTAKAKLFVYSRRSGRLIQLVEDGRHILGLSTGGTDYAQGLTVIMDDVHGNLPLTPTKQALAFGHEQNGKIHEENLYVWLGAYTQYYYQTYLAMHKKKGTLREIVASHEDDVRKNAKREDLRISLMHGRFNSFIAMQFRRNVRFENIRCPISKGQLSVGKDTLVALKRPAPAPPPAPRPQPVRQHQPQITMVQPPAHQHQPQITMVQPGSSQPAFHRTSITALRQNPTGNDRDSPRQTRAKRPKYSEDGNIDTSIFDEEERTVPYTPRSQARISFTQPNGDQQSQQQQPTRNAATPDSSTNSDHAREIADLKAQVKMWKDKYIGAEDEKLELARRVEELNDKNESQEAEIAGLEDKLQETDRKFKQARKALFQRNSSGGMV